ncbi:MAG: DUF4395 domain-containing protein [Acidimicrobiales bacterium]
MTTTTPSLPTAASPRSLFGFPALVNEVAARVVASGVVLMTALYLATGSPLVLVPLVYGFLARVAAGPKLSPLGRLAVEVIVPRLPVRGRLVPGPPKRFAQSIGATLSSGALIAQLTGHTDAAFALIAMITGAALLEAAAGFCLGCTIFGWLMRAGVIPQDTCEACNDLSKHPAFVD